MSDLTKFARPYAKAAFELARDEGQLAEWSDMLDLACQVAQADDVQALIHHPLVEQAKVAELFGNVAGDHFTGKFRQFLDLLAENGRLDILPAVSELYSALRREEEKRLRVRVVSARALSDEQRERLSQALASRFEREIEMETEVDEKLLGGAVVQAGDLVIDGSVRGRLKKLSAELLN